jgi:hypothetical protein
LIKKRIREYHKAIGEQRGKGAMAEEREGWKHGGGGGGDGGDDDCDDDDDDDDNDE